MIKKLSLICPRLEFAVSVCSPHKKKVIWKIERIQKAATKIALNLTELAYRERLLRLNLPTLEKRRGKGDVTFVYRASKEMARVDRKDLIGWDVKTTRGHGKKLQQTLCKDTEKYTFQ